MAVKLDNKTCNYRKHIEGRLRAMAVKLDNKTRNYRKPIEGRLRAMAVKLDNKTRNYRKPPTSSVVDDDDGGLSHAPSGAPGSLSCSWFGDARANSFPVPGKKRRRGDGEDVEDQATLFPSSVSGDLNEGFSVSMTGSAGGDGGEDRATSQCLATPSDRSASNGQALRNASPLTTIEDSQRGAASLRIASSLGYKMLRSMGWRENTGLGQSSDGILDPILPTAKSNHLGIGFNPAARYEAAQEVIRQIQKAKLDERDRKRELKLQQAEEAEEEERFMRESYLAVLSSISNEHQLESDVQRASSDLRDFKPPADPGQCPHCRQRFDTKHALKSHINARHAKQLRAAKRQLKDKRQGGRRRGGGSSSKRGGTRCLAPMSQDFSVYD